MKPFTISQAPAATDELTLLLDTSFGPGRFARTAERLREHNQPIADYAFTARGADGALLGTISYWPIGVSAGSGEVIGLLLGPLAVHPDMQGQGVGQELMRASLQVVDPQTFAFVMLVGDLPYYEKTGFMTAPSTLVMPGPVDPARLLVRPTDGAHAALCGTLSGKVRPLPEMC